MLIFRPLETAILIPLVTTNFAKKKESDGSAAGGLCLIILGLILFLYALVLEIIVLSLVVYLVGLVFTNKVNYKKILDFVSPSVILSVIPVSYGAGYWTISEMFYYEFAIYNLVGLTAEDGYWISFFFIYVFCGSLILMVFGALIVTNLPKTSTSRLDVFFENLISSIKSGFKIGIIPLVFYFVLMFMDVVPYPYS
tara:strand:+ start:2667 stop:3254 length:588 start_codon:yes stop_codon:yes gene_type:complete